MPKVAQRKSLAYAFIALKHFRNLVLFPMALLYLGKLRKNGRNLYFQARV